MSKGLIKPEEYLYLIDTVLKRSHYRSVLRAMRIEYEDAYQIGAIGLVGAASAYDSRICEFPAFAVMRIRRELNHHFRHLNRPIRRGQVLSLNMPLGYDISIELLDTLEDASPDINSSLIDIMLAKLAGPEKQLLQLLYHQDINRGKEAIKCMKISEDRYYRVLKSLKNQIIDIFGYGPERSVQHA